MLSTAVPKVIANFLPLVVIIEVHSDVVESPLIAKIENTKPYSVSFRCRSFEIRG